MCRRSIEIPLQGRRTGRPDAYGEHIADFQLRRSQRGAGALLHFIQNGVQALRCLRGARIFREQNAFLRVYRGLVTRRLEAKKRGDKVSADSL